MPPRRLWVTLFALALLSVVSLAVAQDKDKPPKTTPKLPAHWDKLGLTPNQLRQVQQTQADYQAKLDALKAQIQQTQDRERAELFKVLTDAQRAKLKQLEADKGK